MGMDVQTRRAIPFEEADTATLRQALSHYANPDNKIGDLVRRGEILRVHKGLYAIAPEFRQAPLSLEILANRIYGPSYFLSTIYFYDKVIIIPDDWVFSNKNLISATLKIAKLIKSN